MSVQIDGDRSVTTGRPLRWMSGIFVQGSTAYPALQPFCYLLPLTLRVQTRVRI
jgi:hypothetical protein